MAETLIETGHIPDRRKNLNDKEQKDQKACLFCV